MRFTQILFLALLIGLSACAQHSAVPAPPAPAPAPEKPAMVGGDQDAQGCKGSAGYQWSQVKKECIRVFETGIRLDPKAPFLDKTFSAFAVFKSEQDNAVAELFMPGSTGSILLNKAAEGGDGAWKNDTYSLRHINGAYTLKDKNGVLLYQGAAH